MTAQAENEELIAVHVKKTGIVIGFASILGVLLVGYRYSLFNTEIDFTSAPATYAFFGFILLGVFGALYIFLRAMVAFKRTLLIGGVFFLLFLIGKFARGEF